MNQIEELFNEISDLSSRRERIIIAVDGRCASGKTTLAESICKRFNCAVFHMDDFFLRPEQRTPERLEIPGGNVDHERFLAEVLTPLTNGAEQVGFRPFDCKTLTLKYEIKVPVTPISVVEGSYSLHPALRQYYDLRIFVTVSAEEQLRRIINRNGSDGARVFSNKWIPLEEKYFSLCNVPEICDAIIQT